MSNYSYNKNFFENIDNESKAYWLGFLYADGCINRYFKNEKLKAMSLELTLQKEDKNHLHKFLQDIKSNVPIKEKIVNKKYVNYRITVCNTKMCRDLIKHGCTPQKSLTLEFPQSIDKYLYPHFIRGYFDGDGCVYYAENNYFYKQKNNNYIQKRFCCTIVGTESFLLSIKTILNEYNIKSTNLSHGNTGRAYEMRIYGFNNILHFYNYLYNDASVYLDRKHDKFQFAFERLNLLPT